MKFRPEYMIPIVILFVVILISVCDSCIYFMPYDREGYDNLHYPLGSSNFEASRDTNIGVKFAASAPVQTTYGNVEQDYGNQEVTYGSEEQDYGNQEVTYGSEEPTYGSQESFTNLEKISSQYGSEKSLDIYSQAKGDLNCQAGPYTNSMGYLCMDDNQKQALQTRGFNQTGGNMQIGQA
jgi:hypothetical protein